MPGWLHATGKLVVALLMLAASAIACMLYALMTTETKFALTEKGRDWQVAGDWFFGIGGLALLVALVWALFSFARASWSTLGFISLGTIAFAVILMAVGWSVAGEYYSPPGG